MADLDYPFGEESVMVRLLQMIIDMSNTQRENLLKHLEETEYSADKISERDDVRKSYTNTVYFTTTSTDEIYEGTSQDISSGGMFIETDESFHMGQLIALTIPFPNGQKDIMVQAEIVRADTRGIGVEFIKKKP